MPNKLATVRDIVTALGGYGPVAARAGVEQNTVRWRQIRERIPPDHWPAIIKLAARKGVEIDHLLLARINRPRKVRCDRRSGKAA